MGLAGSTLVVLGVYFGWFQWIVTTSALHRGHAGGPEILLSALPGLVLVAAIGRIALSLLPPGPIGSHERAGLATTWAASHLLGTVVVALQTAVFPPRPDIGYLLLFVGPWVLAGGLRLATLPARMVPRHAPSAEPTGPGARTLRAAFAVVALSIPVGTLLVFGGDERSLAAPSLEPSFDPAGALPDPVRASVLSVPRRSHLVPGTAEVLLTLASAGPARNAAWRMFVPVSAMALLVLVAYGLAAARRAPPGRWAVLLGLALVVAPLSIANCDFAGEVVLRALGLGAGAALGIMWLRRADRRALWVACAGFLACGLSGGVSLAVAGLAGLVAATAAPARRRALIAAGTTTLVGAAAFSIALAADTRLGVGWGPHSEDLFGSRIELPYWLVAPTLIVVLACFLPALLRRTPDPANDGEADEPAREWFAIGLPLAVGLAGWPLLAGAVYDLPTTLAPLAALLTGLVLVRPERV